MSGSRERRLANPEKWYSPEEVTKRRLYGRKYWADRKEERTRSFRKCRYGLNEDAFQKMLLTQENKCAVCRKEFGPELKMQIDHDHNTKKVRGLLCARCNHAIGHARDCPEILEAAAVYLRKHGK